MCHVAESPVGMCHVAESPVGMCHVAESPVGMCHAAVTNIKPNFCSLNADRYTAVLSLTRVIF